MTKREFDRALKTKGFTRQTNPLGGTRFVRQVDGRLQYVARNSVQGGSWRLLLAIGDVPEIWATHQVGTISRFTEGESPWFQYFSDLDLSELEDPRLDNSDRALSRMFDWFQAVGERWLSNPTAKTDDAWKREHNLLVRVDNCVRVGPGVRKLPP